MTYTLSVYCPETRLNRTLNLPSNHLPDMLNKRMPVKHCLVSVVPVRPLVPGDLPSVRSRSRVERLKTTSPLG